MSLIAVALAVAAASATTAPSPAPSTSPPPAPLASSRTVVSKLDAGLAALTGGNAGQSQSLEVVVAENGRIVYERAFGSVASTTRFPIASITKMFTAVSIMQLVEQKRINLDAAVATYFPSAPYATQITVRELLQHTSGLWNYADYAVNSGMATKATAPDAILKMVGGYPLTSTPGQKWAYSNTGYVVLGRIVERVSGEPLAKYEREHIYNPAGMTETTMGIPTDGSATAAGYMSANGPPAANYDRSWFFGCGDIVSTAGDLARFDLALMNGTLLAPATFTQMQTETVPAQQYTQGLGLAIYSSLGMTFVGHHGGVPGYETQDQMLPSQGVAWIVLSNAFDFGTYRADRVVLGALFPTYMAALTASTTKAREDHGVTQRFVAALTGLMRGSVDRSQYSDAASAALTPQLLAQSSSALDSLGDVTKVEFIGGNATAQASLYEYRVSYSTGKTLTWQFVIDAGGKIAEILATNPT
ncbi:MAG TPA: serine hydrolase domain-containing protein [Candidatus Tumulicola sp.]